MLEKDDAQLGDLVVVGSSAGGIEALSILVSTLPKNFPAPIVLAQHLDPSRSSSLDLILQKHTTLPVEVVTANMHIKAGTIYVIPSNYHVSIMDHQIELHDNHKKRPRPSIDTLFSSASQAYGDRLIAVILTGSGSDGAIGAVDVKNAGGTVIIQDPKTARYPSMPLALPPTSIDFEVSLEQIGSLLYDLLRGVNLPHVEERTEDILRDILDLVNRQASIDFRPYKTSTILRRISRRMAVTHSQSMRAYAEYLKLYPQEVGELVKAFLINVTQFFRDPEAFEYLKREILPVLIARARESDRILRFWTAGCATGEEPYSLAMLLMDLLEGDLLNWSIKIFATDLDEGAITFARRGLYSENLLESLPSGYRERFFSHSDQGDYISKGLRQMVIFGQQNLSHSAPFPRIDLVLCRNVLIYFTPELQDYVLNQFAFSLSPQGYLFLGKAETVRPMQSFYELMNKSWKIYRCISNILPTTRMQSMLDSRALQIERTSAQRSNQPVNKYLQSEALSSSQEVSQMRRFNELLLRFLPIGVVIIDHNYHIMIANSTARRLLNLRDTATDQDFLHAVHGIPYHELRSAIDTVFHERTFMALPEVELAISSGGNGRFVSLSIALMQVEPGLSELASVSVIDVTEQVQIRRQLETVQVEQSQLMQELGTANKRLSDMNKELMDANEEFQVANEELMLTHEELQASIEEFETTNEELQATNEELETNNEELQATNEELETMNEELRARTSELQEITTNLETERLRLNEMVELSPFYILVLRSPVLTVDAYNPRYGRFLEGRELQGRPLEEVMDFFWEPQFGLKILRVAHDVYVQERSQTISRTHMPEIEDYEGTKSVKEHREGYFSYTLVPTHSALGRVDGIIIYAFDETEQQIREIAEELGILTTIFDNTNAGVLALYDAQTRVLVMGSPRYLELVIQTYKRSPKEIIGLSWEEIAFLSSRDEAIQYWQTAVKNQTPFHVPELARALLDGSETIWEYDLTPIVKADQPGIVRYMLVSAVEITIQDSVDRTFEQID